MQFSILIVPLLGVVTKELWIFRSMVKVMVIFAFIGSELGDPRSQQEPSGHFQTNDATDFGLEEPGHEGQTLEPDQGNTSTDQTVVG